jgi:hypothetical protein
VTPTETSAPTATSTIHTDQLFGKGTVMTLAGAFVLALLAGVAAFVRR